MSVISWGIYKGTKCNTQPSTPMAPSSRSRPLAQPVAPAAPAALYPMTDTDRNLRLVAFIFCILSLVGSCWLIIPLAWMIPMSVISWGIYKGTKANTVAFDVCRAAVLEDQ